MGIQTVVSFLIGIIVTAINTYIGVKIKARDEDIRRYREEREKLEKERQEKEENERKLSEESTKALMRIELRTNYIECKNKGYYSMEDKEVFHPLFVAYKDLGGDGIVDQWRDELVRMPIEEPLGHKLRRILLKR